MISGDAPSLRAPFTLEREPTARWHWRNCRSLGIGVSLWPLNWALGLRRQDDVYGGSINVALGPLNVELSYSIGGPDEPFGLCEAEAWERAVAFESNRKDGSSQPNNPALQKEPPHGDH